MYEIINFQNALHINQINVLPSIIEGNILLTRDEAEPVIHDDLILPYTVNVLVHNETTLALQPSNYNRITRTINLVRYNKAAQALLLRDFMKTLKQSTERYVHLPVWSIPPAGIDSKKISLSPGNYVVKLAYGARSLSIFKITVGKYNFDEINKHIDKCMSNFAATKEAVEASEDVTVAYVNELNNLSAELLKLGVHFKVGEERTNYEASDMYFSQTKFVQKEMSNPFIELRIIRSLNGNTLVMGREDLKEDHVGLSTHIKNSEDLLKYLGKYTHPNSTANIADVARILSDILYCVESDDFPSKYGSIDVWIKHNLTGWGIFEFQPQYNPINIPDEVHTKFITECMKEFINRTKVD